MEMVRADDCKEVMTHFFLRLIRDAVGDAEPEEVEDARVFIKKGYLEKDDQISPFTFDQLCMYVQIPIEVIQPVLYDLELIGWRKNSIIFKILLQRLNQT